jgi:predicted ribosomally synthesized peptide with SipW-like signal peptide
MLLGLLIGLLVAGVTFATWTDPEQPRWYIVEEIERVLGLIGMDEKTAAFRYFGGVNSQVQWSRMKAKGSIDLVRLWDKFPPEFWYALSPRLMYRKAQLQARDLAKGAL